MSSDSCDCGKDGPALDCGVCWKSVPMKIDGFTLVPTEGFVFEDYSHEWGDETTFVCSFTCLRRAIQNRDTCEKGFISDMVRDMHSD